MAEVQLPAGAARSKGLGCCPTSPCKARGFVHTKTLLAAAIIRISFYSFRKFQKSAFHTVCAGVCRVYKFPKGTRTLKQSLVCYTSPGGVYGSDDGRNSVLFDQFAHMFLVLLHLFVPVFHGAFLNAAARLSCTKAGSSPCLCAYGLIMPTLDRGQSRQLAASPPLYLTDPLLLHSKFFPDGPQ